MLQANVTPSLIPQQFRCHARMNESLRKRFWRIGTMSDRGRSIRHRVMTRRQDRQNRRSQLLNHFRPVTVTARAIPQTHNPRISALTVTKYLREIGDRPLYMFYMRRFFFGLVYFHIQRIPMACSIMRVPGVLSNAFSLNASARQGACKRSLFKSIDVSPENQRWLPKQ